MEITEKNKLRKKYILIRDKIQNKPEKSKIIVEKLKHEQVYKNAKTIAIYKSLPSEVDTSELIKHSINLNKCVALPRVIGYDMEFYKIHSLNDNFVKNKFGIEEPKNNKENYINKEQIDLVIVPGICFDKQKNRLGFGKGFYDKYLQKSNLYTIAVGFDEQILEEILPIDKTDVKMNKIITDKSIY